MHSEWRCAWIFFCLPVNWCPFSLIWLLVVLNFVNHHNRSGRTWMMLRMSLAYLQPVFCRVHFLYFKSSWPYARARGSDEVVHVASPRVIQFMILNYPPGTLSRIAWNGPTDSNLSSRSVVSVIANRHVLINDRAQVSCSRVLPLLSCPPPTHCNLPVVKPGTGSDVNNIIASKPQFDLSSASAA